MALGPITVEGHRIEVGHAGTRIQVEMAQDERGRWRPVEVTIIDPHGVHPEAVRKLPLRAIEAAANGERLAAMLLAGTGGHPRSRRPPIKLGVPAGPGRKPDQFYRAVATAFVWLATQTGSPAAVLAKENKVPVTTAHRWLKEARSRGLLAAGQRGRAT